MKNKDKENNNKVEISSTIAGIMLGVSLWNELYNSPNKQVIKYYEQFCRTKSYSTIFMPKILDARWKIIRGLPIIPITAGTFYLFAKTHSLFAKKQRFIDAAATPSENGEAKTGTPEP